MKIPARSKYEGDVFGAARDQFDEILRWLHDEGTPLDHAILEEDLSVRGTELLRRLYQARLDLLSNREGGEDSEASEPREDAERKKGAPKKPKGKGKSAKKRSRGRPRSRARGRQLESIFGRLRFKRQGIKVVGEKTRYPLDERLKLPEGLYTLPLQRRVAEEGRSGAWNHVVERIDASTGGHVPKRQAEAIAQAATRDFDAFYKESQPANDTAGGDTLLLASSDGKGIRMVPQALREATRKEAEADQAKAVRGDPMAQKKPRLHAKRMAVVTAVWEQEPLPRTAQDIVRELRRAPRAERTKTPRQALPKRKNPRVWASVEKSLATGVGEMFDDLDRRDPSRQRPAIVLVDGEENQQTAILDQGRIRSRRLTIVLDVIHVLHYLWCAGFVLCRKKAEATDLWVARNLLQLLSQPVAMRIATIDAEAAKRRLSVNDRKQVDKALKYFRRNAPFMDYPGFLARGLPIATGVIEGACRHLVQDRLGITGARWDLAGADAVLKLRALHASDDWHAYWQFHQRQEALRRYDAAA
jgi:hypothetical protein